MTEDLVNNDGRGLTGENRRVGSIAARHEVDPLDPCRLIQPVVPQPDQTQGFQGCCCAPAVTRGAVRQACGG